MGEAAPQKGMRELAALLQQEQIRMQLRGPWR